MLDENLKRQIEKRLGLSLDKLGEMSPENLSKLIQSLNEIGSLLNPLL
jgi:hypothetical protein